LLVITLIVTFICLFFAICEHRDVCDY